MWEDHLALIHDRSEVRVYDLENNAALIERYRIPEGPEMGAYPATTLSDRYVVFSNGNQSMYQVFQRSTRWPHVQILGPPSPDPSFSASMAILGSFLAYEKDTRVYITDVDTLLTRQVETPSMGYNFELGFAGESRLVLLHEFPVDNGEGGDDWTTVVSLCDIGRITRGVSAHWRSSARLGIYCDSLTAQGGVTQTDDGAVACGWDTRDRCVRVMDCVSGQCSEIRVADVHPADAIVTVASGDNILLDYDVIQADGVKKDELVLLMF